MRPEEFLPCGAGHLDFYLLVIPVPVLVSPFTRTSTLDLLKTSNLWLGPLQGLVGAALGVLFASKKPKGAD